MNCPDPSKHYKQNAEGVFMVPVELSTVPCELCGTLGVIERKSVIVESGAEDGWKTFVSLGPMIVHLNGDVCADIKPYRRRRGEESQ